MTNFSTLSYTWSFRAEHPRIGHYREYRHSRLEWYDDLPWQYDMFFRSYMWRHPIFPSFGNHQISGLHTYNDDDDYNDNNTLQYYWIRLSIIWRIIENEEGVISRERLRQLTRAHSRRRPALSTIKAPFRWCAYESFDFIFHRCLPSHNLLLFRWKSYSCPDLSILGVLLNSINSRAWVVSCIFLKQQYPWWLLVKLTLPPYLEMMFVCWSQSLH